ncbi:hypothetical protein I4U23_000261 [Adineta vaga]|nr:hypothetical protein I4U23_000261 [Adineta vaga]
MQSNAEYFTPMMLAAYRDLRPIVDLLFQLLPSERCIDDLGRLACRYTLDPEMVNPEMAFYFFTQSLNEKSSLDDSTLYEVYDFRRECQTLEQLESIRDNNHAMRMHALLVNERTFLQHGDPEIYFFLIEQQCNYYSDNHMFLRSLQLRLHTCQLILQIQNDNYDTKALHRKQCISLAEDLEFMWNEDEIVSVDILVTVINWSFSSTAHYRYLSLYINLLKIAVCMIQSKQTTQKDQYALIAVVRRIARKELIGSFLSHFINEIVKKRTTQHSGSYSFSTFSVICLLIQCGADVNDVFDRYGNRPLHLIASCSNVLVAKPVIQLLLDYGAHPDVVDYAGRHPVDLTWDHDVKNLLSNSKHLSLKCRCAQLTSKNLNYQKYLTPKLHSFIQLHTKSHQKSIID